MSDYRVASGFMAELAFPVPKDQMSETTDKLYNIEGNNIFVNYEGTLIYSEDLRKVLYDFDIQIGSITTPEDFIQKCNDLGLPIIGEPKQFFTVWYDGSDSTQNMTKLKDFQASK